MFKMTGLLPLYKINSLAAYLHIVIESSGRLNDEYLTVISPEEIKFKSKC